MRSASESVASGSCPSVGSRLTTGGAFASAGILALGLVAAPPHFDGAGNEVRAVNLAAFTLPPPTPPSLLLQKLISNHARTVVPATPVLGGKSDIATAVVTTPLDLQAIGATAQPVNVPAINSQLVNNAAPAATADFDWEVYLQEIYDQYIAPVVAIAGG